MRYVSRTRCHHTDILRPKRVGQSNIPHIKVDANLAVVGTCNITYGFVVDGTDVVTEVPLRALKAHLAFTGTIVKPVSSGTSTTVASNLNLNGRLSSTA